MASGFSGVGYTAGLAEDARENKRKNLILEAGLNKETEMMKQKAESERNAATNASNLTATGMTQEGNTLRAGMDIAAQGGVRTAQVGAYEASAENNLAQAGVYKSNARKENFETDIMTGLKDDIIRDKKATYSATIAESDLTRNTAIKENESKGGMPVISTSGDSPEYTGSTLPLDKAMGSVADLSVEGKDKVGTKNTDVNVANPNQVTELGSSLAGHRNTSGVSAQRKKQTLLMPQGIYEEQQKKKKKVTTQQALATPWR